MKINTFNYLVLNSIKDLKRNRSLTISFLFSICITLFMFGLLSLYMMTLTKTYTNIFFKYDSSYTSFIHKFFYSMQFIVLIIIAPLSVSLIWQIVKIIIHCRKQELLTMKLIGATNSFIICPFIINGVLIGLIGSLLTTLILYAFYNFLYSKLLLLSLPVYFVKPDVIINSLFNYFLIAGILVCSISNILALKKLKKCYHS